MVTEKLDPDAVRHRASSIPGCKEVPLSQTQQQREKGATVLSFLVGLVDDTELDGSQSQLARFHIYCNTGSVSIARILMGQVRQIFRRHVYSLDAVERLLRDPPLPTSIDRQLVSLEDNGSNETQKDTALQELSLQQQIELADVGLAILRAEREKLQCYLDTVVDVVGQNPLPRPNSTEKREPKQPTIMGVEFQFSLEHDTMIHVDQCLEEIANMKKLVKHVSINGKAALFCYGNGGVAYTPAIPRPLHYELSLLKDKNQHIRPIYGVLGTRERYYLALQDGSFRFKGPKRLQEELKKYHDPPRSIAFGDTYDSFFVVHHDHSYTYHGNSIPKGLIQKLQSRQDKADLVCVSLGPSGEWFARAKNGRLWWGGVSEDLDDALADLLDEGHTLCYLDFGANESYFVSYDD